MSADPIRWPARLTLSAARDGGGATRVHARHDGPLRLLKTLYPEGDGVAQAVLVHPPGGLVGGQFERRVVIDGRTSPAAAPMAATRSGQ